MYSGASPAAGGAYSPSAGGFNMAGAGIGAGIGGTAGYFLGDAIGGKTGGTIGAILGALVGAYFGGGFEDGAAFHRGRVIPHADGDVFDRPTMFPMSGGDTGVLGEAGPEAIMPLRRDARGRLGVSAPQQQADRRVKVTNVFNLPPAPNGFGHSPYQIAQRAGEHAVRALR
jgi:phage-related minor tail protein